VDRHAVGPLLGVGATVSEPVDIAELRRLLSEASPGPWESRRRAHENDLVIASEAMPVLAELRSRPTSAKLRTPADAALIAAAVNALPELLDVVEAAQAVRDAVLADDARDPGIGQIVSPRELNPLLDRLDAALARVRVGS
jgi:hypothetical protein